MVKRFLKWKLKYLWTALMNSKGTFEKLAIITYTQDVGFITITNPPVNALSVDLVSAINKIIDNISKSIKVLVLKSEGKGFCAGADLKERALMNDNETIRIVDAYKNLFNKIDNLSCPTIATIHGYALGGGLELALACDFRFSTSDSIFGFPETNLGIIPGAGGTQRLPRLVGLTKAKEWIFTADRFTAKKALEDNVIDKVFDSSFLMEEGVARFSSDVAKNSQRAISLAKKSINYAIDSSLQEGLIFEREQYLKTLKDPIRLERLKKNKNK